jgi:[ribosomal protein S18]-alanine N-acetyltransferase
MMVREANSDDIPSLMQLESISFETDRFSRRTFRHLLTRANAATFVDVDRRGGVSGYATVLLRRGARAARLYSIAVAPGMRRRGVAGRLLTAAERAARRLGADRIRLEVRRDNRPAYALYARAGYAQFGLRPGYYADGMDAARLEKALRS